MLTDKLIEKFEANSKAVSNSILNLRSMLNLGNEFGGEAFPGHYAITAILKYYGINTVVPDVPLNTLSEAGRILSRYDFLGVELTLTKNWWKHAGDPILAVCEDGMLVTLLPDFGGYRMADPKTGKKVKLDEQFLSKLKPEALSVIQDLPKRPVSSKEFKRYCLRILPRRSLIMAFVLCVLTTLLCMCVPIANKTIFSEVIPSGVTNGIIPICGFLLAAGLSSILFQFCRNFALIRCKDKFNAVLQTVLFNRLLHLPAPFFKKYSAGNLGTRILAANNVYQLITNEILTSFAAALFAGLYIIVAIMYAKSMIIVIVYVMLFAVGACIFQYKRLGSLYRAAIPNSVSAQDFAYSAILSIQKIKNCRAEQRAFAQWVKRYSKSEVVDKYCRIIYTTLKATGFFLAQYCAWKSRIPVSDFVAFMSAYGVMSYAITEAVGFTSTVANISPYIDMLQPILGEDVENKDDYPIVTDITGRIDIHNVTFQYKPDSPKILDNFSLHIPAGQNIAIVGKSGCGKSTLMSLLLGFEEPQSGSIYYGPYNISTVNLSSLRQFFGFCPQSTQIIPGTIAENIRFSTRTCSQEELWEAARIACLDDDIRKMPKQMDTILGEDGNGMSGGQCQRLLIARAVLNKPKVLFLDEATSALDNITQRQVIDNLAEFGCTRIAIAHRLSTVMHCDRVIVMDKGKIIEDGKPQQLMEQKGFFYELSKRQM